LRFIYNKYAYSLCFSLTFIIHEFNESKEIDKERLKFNLQFSLEAHAYCKNNTSDEEGSQDTGVQCDIDQVIRENRESQLKSCRVALDFHKWSLDRIRGSDAKTNVYTLCGWISKYFRYIHSNTNRNTVHTKMQ
jgi:hypothetical protein